MFQDVGLYRIIQSNKELKFDVQENFLSWMCDGLWYNPTICAQLHGSLFETSLELVVNTGMI